MKLVGGAIRAVSVEMIGVLFVLWIMFGAAGWTLDHTAADATRKTDRLLDWVSTQTGQLADRVASVSRAKWHLFGELVSRDRGTAPATASADAFPRGFGECLTGSWPSAHHGTLQHRSLAWFRDRVSHLTGEQPLVRPRGYFGSLLGGATDQDRIVLLGEERLESRDVTPDCFARLLGAM
jgi:hypothetical protein